MKWRDLSIPLVYARRGILRHLQHVRHRIAISGEGETRILVRGDQFLSSSGGAVLDPNAAGESALHDVA
jgi:hypothetical protein